MAVYEQIMEPTRSSKQVPGPSPDVLPIDGQEQVSTGAREYAHLCHMTYAIYFFIHVRVWAKLDENRPHDYNRCSGYSAGFAWNDVPTAGKISEATYVYEVPPGIAYRFSAKILRIEDKFE